MVAPKLPLVLALTALVPSLARADYVDHFATDADIGLMKVPHRGQARVLVIPLIVDDQPLPGGEAEWLDDLRAFMEPARRDTFGRYFRTTSLGRYDPKPWVAPAIHFATCPKLGTYEGCVIPRGGGLQSGDLTHAIALIGDVIRFAHEIFECARQGPDPSRRCTGGTGVDFSGFDTSGRTPGRADGFVDGVIIVSNSKLPAIALPVGWLAQHPLFRSAERPLPKLEYDGVRVGAVAIAGGIYGTAARTRWVSIHEFGHLLGFADLYNEDGTTTDLPYSPMGGWYYNNPPPLLDPFSRAAIGWANVEHAGGQGRYRLTPSVDGGRVLKVGLGPEYFLVEYRVGRPDVDGDLQIPAGVIVQRVNLERAPSKVEGYFLLNTLPKCLNCRRWEPFLMFEQADGLYDVQFGREVDDANDVFLVGDAIGPSDDVAPRGDDHIVFSTNRFSGARTDVTIRVVAIEPGYAEVEIDAPAPPDACAELTRLCLDRRCEEGVCEELPPPPVDAGVVDVGPPDAGAPDAPGPDAIEPDALVDAGSAPDAAPDAEVVADAGAGAGGGGEGCGCGATGGPAGLGPALLALALVLVGRRRRCWSLRPAPRVPRAVHPRLD